MTYFDIPGTIRVLISLYNTKEEIDVMVEAVKEQH
jgi:cysteine desulfurase/selenocysteine lyase